MNDDRKESPNQALVDGLRDLADFVEHYPTKVYADLDIMTFPEKLEDLKALPIGKLEKVVIGEYFALRKCFGGNVSMTWLRDREKVCKKVNTGTRIIEKPIMQQIGTEKVVEETFEWQCPPSIMSMLSPREPEQIAAEPSSDPFLPVPVDATF